MPDGRLSVCRIYQDDPELLPPCQTPSLPNSDTSGAHCAHSLMVWATKKNQDYES